MYRYFAPDFYFDTFDKVSVEFLIEQKIDTLLLDVDNTLAPYEQADPDERILKWLSSLSQNGIKYAFVSNNESTDRIDRFNKNIKAPAFARSAKPFFRNAKKALKILNSKRENTAIMGDQIFTDVCAGKWHGMRAILVPPIKDKTTLFFRIKRKLEKPIMKRFFKEHNIKR